MPISLIFVGENLFLCVYTGGRIRMKVAILGSRSINNTEFIEKKIEKSPFSITQIFTSSCDGVCKIARTYGKKKNIEVSVFHPDWETFGRRAAIVRNKNLLHCAEAALIFWDEISKGTKQEIDYSNKINLPFLLYLVSEIPNLFNS